MQLSEKINLIPDQIQQNKLSRKEAVNFLSSELFKNPEYFLRRSIPDEDLSDLIFKVLTDEEKIFNHFDKIDNCFFDYFCSYLFYKILSNKKNKTKAMIVESTCNSSQIMDYENDEEKYYHDEYCYKSSQYEPYILQDTDTVPYTRNKHFINFDDDNFNITLHLKKLSATKKTALICAIKCCYYLDYKYLQLVSEYCKLPENFIHNIKEKLNSTFEKKVEKMDLLIKRRDNAYYLKRKYSLEMDSLKKANKDISEKEKNYNFQKINWLSKIEQIKKMKVYISPSNKQIAKELGMKERMISFYISKADQIAEENVM